MYYRDIVTLSKLMVLKLLAFPVIKSLPANAGDVGLSPRTGRSPGREHNNPLQYSCLENPMNRGVWWATIYGVKKGQTQLSTHTQTSMCIRMTWGAY